MGDRRFLQNNCTYLQTKLLLEENTQRKMTVQTLSIANLHAAGSSQKLSFFLPMLLNLNVLQGHPKPTQSLHCESHHGSKEMNNWKPSTAMKMFMKVH
jgi:hypothetical protein